MTPSRPARVLSILDLPAPVSELFQRHFDLITGVIEDANRFEPDVLLCSIEPVRFDEERIARLPASVQAIATYSVGHDHIDLVAAANRNIAIFNTPGVLADSVADAALLLILAAARRATESIGLLRGGGWQGWSPTQLNGVELRAKTLGILGMGEIGRRVAARARGFGMEIAYHNRRPRTPKEGRYVADPRQLIRESDVLVLAWPSTAETRHFIAAETLALAKRGMILVNIGRGDLVRDDDLIAALRAGRIFAAGLDVFDGEPDIHPGYLELSNAFLLPHIGSSTREARLAMAQILVDALESHMDGKQSANRLV